MCIDCLNNVLESVLDYETEIKDYLNTFTCECDNCHRKVWANFLLGVCQDLQVLTSVKVKQNTPLLCTSVVSRFEGLVRLKIKNKLTGMVEFMDENKEQMQDNSYLCQMNQLKSLNDFVVSINEADHN